MSIAEMPGGSTTEVAILGSLFGNGKAELTPQRARYLLELQFSESDNDRMRTLAAKNQDGQLSDAERDELLGYAKAGCLLGILHSRARRALAKPNGRRRSG
jgi:hypothetical protein